MAAHRSTLIVPVESQVRELDAKILLSCVAAERGFPVILGSRAFVHHKMASLPRGVYLAKSMRTLSDRMFGILKQLGFDIVGYDEEGLVRFPDPYYYRRRLSAKALRDVSILLAWGRDDARAFRDFPGTPEIPIHVTGNPRIDLLRPELRAFFDEEVREIRKRYGAFVILNTNFSGINHFYANLSQLKEAIEQKDGESTDPFMVGRGAHRNALYGHFRKAVPALSEALSDLNVIVRPHPAEGHEAWREAAAGLENVHVVNEGNVAAWLLAARALVHNGCTTAAEAAVLGTPSVAFQPVISDEYDNHLPNSLSHRALDLKELQKTVRALVDREIAPREDWQQRRVLAGHLEALDGPLAADRMVEVLEDAGYLSRLPERSGIGGYLRGWLHVHLRAASKQVNMRRPGHRNNLAYHEHRFPGVTADELRSRIDRLGRLLGRFEGIRVEPLHQHIFRIER